MGASSKFDFEIVRHLYPKGSTEALQDVFGGSWDRNGFKEMYGALADRILTDNP